VPSKTRAKRSPPYSQGKKRKADRPRSLPWIPQGEEKNAVPPQKDCGTKGALHLEKEGPRLLNALQPEESSAPRKDVSLKRDDILSVLISLPRFRWRERGEMIMSNGRERKKGRYLLDYGGKLIRKLAKFKVGGRLTERWIDAPRVEKGRVQNSWDRGALKEKRERSLGSTSVG